MSMTSTTATNTIWRVYIRGYFNSGPELNCWLPSHYDEAAVLSWFKERAFLFRKGTRLVADRNGFREHVEYEVRGDEMQEFI